MHENNFEKQVREKMDQLGFDPSDAVWAAVDKEINKEKKRRGPLFFLLFLSGLILVGGGFYLNSIKNSTGKEAAGQQQKIKTPLSPSSGKAQAGISHETMSSEKSVNPILQNIKKNQNGRLNKYATVKKSGKQTTGLNNTLDIKEGKSNKSKQLSISEKTNGVHSEKSNASLGTGEALVAGNNNIDSNAGKKLIAASVTKTAIKDSVTNQISVTKENRNRKQPLWEIGYSANVGISNINQNLFKSANITSQYSYTPAANGPNSTPPPVPVSTTISPGLSFGIGVFVNRNLSKRISFSAGFNYHYYSTKIKTGSAVDSALLVYNAFSQSGIVNGYYRNGSSNEYTNQYHFIELPVTVNFQLNKSSRTPIIWEAGFSLSYLINTNALLYDSYGNVYYKNAEFFNKMQLNGTTSIMVGFSIHKSELQIGPQLQYGLTGLLNTSAGNPEHLFYGGLKISFIPGIK